MSEKQNGLLPNWSKALFGLLIVVVAFEGYMIYRLSADEDTGGSPQAEQSVASVTDTQAAQPSIAMPDLPLLQPQPFDPKTWDPFTEMQQMHQQMNDMFNNAFGKFGQSDRYADLLESEFPPSPKVDLTESDDAYDVTVDLPGAEQSEIKTSIEGQMLTIAGETDKSVESQDNQKDNKIIRKERLVGKFDRSIYLPEPVDASKMETRYENGVLSIHIPKAGDEAGTHS